MGKRLLAAALSLIVCAAAAASETTEQRLAKQIQSVHPLLKVTRVTPTQVPGLYEVVVGANTILYASEDGRYVIEGGDLVDLRSRRSLTEPRRAELRVGHLGLLSPKDMVVYQAVGERKHVITVFTDINCPYCRKFHEGIEAMNAAGIEVRYVLLSILGPDSAAKAKAVWCAPNRMMALTEAKQGKELEAGECQHPLERHKELAQKLGINATPTIVSSHGTLIGSYVPPAELLLRLQVDAKESAAQTASATGAR